MGNSLAHWVGEFTFSDQRSPRDSWMVSLVTFGEGYHNSHHNAPFDYRNGIHLTAYVPPKWIIAALEWAGLAWNLKRFDTNTLLKGKVHMKQKQLDEQRRSVEWGPEVTDLPKMTRAEFDERAKGERLVLVDHVAHDVADFEEAHPGGAALLRAYVGRDATAAFYGASYNHSLAARHMLRTMRKYQLPGATEDSAEADVIPLEGESVYFLEAEQQRQEQ